MIDGRKQGIEVLRHDEGTYLVQSRTNREDYYIVDIDENTCTCDDWQFRHSSRKGFECFHLQYAKYLFGYKAPKPTQELIAA